MSTKDQFNEALAYTMAVIVSSIQDDKATASFKVVLEEIGALREQITALERQEKQVARDSMSCHLCNLPVIFEFTVESTIWNRIVRAKGIDEYLCFWCFAKLAGDERIPVGVNVHSGSVFTAWCGGDVPGAYPNEATADSPIDMLLFCPECDLQHVDAPSEGWTNPPHKSHLCRLEDGGCGTVWRPADAPTNGVRAIQTSGEKDTWRITQHDQSTIAARKAREKAFERDWDERVRNSRVTP